MEASNKPLLSLDKVLADGGNDRLAVTERD